MTYLLYTEDEEERVPYGVVADYMTVMSFILPDAKLLQDDNLMNLAAVVGTHWPYLTHPSCVVAIFLMHRAQSYVN